MSQEIDEFDFLEQENSSLSAKKSQNRNSKEPKTFIENIRQISPNKKIFILSNKNNSVSMGDFVSLIMQKKLIARALVAKTNSGLAGLKILKIYNPRLWKKLYKKGSVHLLKGDDSYYLAQLRESKKKKKESDQKKSLIRGTEDLFNETIVLDEEKEFEDSDKNRKIKSDNLISVHFGRIEGVSTSGNPKEYNQLSIHWAYQLQENIFIEASYGQNIIRDFPAMGLDSKLSNFVLKAKYAFNTPLNTILFPYLGYQVINASSPGEGVYTTGMTEADIAAETALMNSLRKKAFIFGATVLKKLVPGWFTRLDLGTDFYSLGFGLEF